MFHRRQTAEEREQERQAATKYFLSMQLGSMNSPPRSSASATSGPSNDASANKAGNEDLSSNEVIFTF
jgi:hypothetical protein